MYIGIRIKYPLFLSDFNESWSYLTDFRKMLKYKISWKSAQWEPSCSNRDGWAGGHREVNNRFSRLDERIKIARMHNRYWQLALHSAVFRGVGTRRNIFVESRDSSVTIVTRTRSGQPKYRLRTRAGTTDFSYFFSEAFTPALVPTPPPTQWVLVALLRGVNRTTYHKVPDWEWLELYLRSPIRLCGFRRAALHNLSTYHIILYTWVRASYVLLHILYFAVHI